MFHSDCGSQYTAFEFRQLLDSLIVVHFFTMHVMNVSSSTSNKKKTITLCKNYSFLCSIIERFYNSKRPHGSFEMMTPNKNEELY